MARLRGVVGGAIRGGFGAARHPRNASALVAQSWAMAEMMVRDELMAAPHTSLNGKIGATRRLAAVDVPLEDLKRVKRELGGTVNDVVLAATAGGLRRLFEARGEDVDHIRAMVPVSVRAASESLALGNRVSSLFVDLVVAEPDPLLRYRKIAAASRELKEGGAARRPRRRDQARRPHPAADPEPGRPPHVHAPPLQRDDHQRPRLAGHPLRPGRPPAPHRPPGADLLRPRRRHRGDELRRRR